MNILHHQQSMKQKTAGSKSKRDVDNNKTMQTPILNPNNAEANENIHENKNDASATHQTSNSQTSILTAESSVSLTEGCDDSDPDEHDIPHDMVTFLHDEYSTAYSLSRERSYSLPAPFVQIDNALAQYYTSHGRTNYYGADDQDGINGKIGKFARFVLEKQYDEKEIDQELACDREPMQCAYIQFDYDGFPLSCTDDDAQHDHDRALLIFTVIQHCHKYGEPPPNPTVQHMSSMDTTDPETPYPASMPSIDHDRYKTYTQPP